jgi:hypothetical protein
MVIVLLLSACALAHKPIFSSTAATDPNTAIALLDPNVSQVVYRVLSKTGQVWTTFTAPAHFNLFIQMGTPVIERQKHFRPSVAVLGPRIK